MATYYRTRGYYRIPAFRRHFTHPNINPNRLVNNCVSVTLAKILAYRDVHEFWRATVGHDMPDEPLYLDEMEDLVSKTGWSLQIKYYWTSYGGSAYHQLIRCIRTLYHTRGHSPLLGLQLAITYYRDRRDIGHVVVVTPIVTLTGEWDVNHFPSINFTCYQSVPEGLNVLRQVQEATRIELLVLKCPAATRTWDNWIYRSNRMHNEGYYSLIHEIRAGVDLRQTIQW